MRGDGNCYYRAAYFSIVEQLITHGQDRTQDTGSSFPVLGYLSASGSASGSAAASRPAFLRLHKVFSNIGCLREESLRPGTGQASSNFFGSVDSTSYRRPAGQTAAR